MSTDVGRATPSQRPARMPRLVVGVVVPMAIATASYALWYVSDRLLYIGPLDRAAFGWVVVIPVWLATPIVAALLWRPMTRQATRAAALALGGIIALVASALFWNSVAFPDCPAGPIRTATEWILPALILGATVGGGVAGVGLMGTAIVRSGHRWWSVVVTAGSGFAMIFVAILVFIGVSLGAGLGSVGPCGLPQ